MVKDIPTVKVENEKQFYDYYVKDVFQEVFNGDKYPGSFGPTKLYDFVDYWTLRERSLQLFKENPYAIGIIRRIIRNEIFTGIVPDATPLANIIWPDMDDVERTKLATEIGEMLTTNFNLYGDDHEVFDYKKQQTFGEFQAQVRMEALLCGDGIVISRINPVTNLPCWEWINGNHIKTPMEYTPPEGYIIKHGVEMDMTGRHVAYHVQRIINGELQSYRVPVYGPQSGRIQAKMVYGTERIIDDVRSVPILACMLYMLKDVDRYRDAEQRAAVVNAMLPMFIKRPSSSSLGSRPTAAFTVPAGTPPPPVNGIVDAPKPPNVAGMVPGTILDDLAPGEEPVSFNTNRPNVNYKAFEEAILDVFCWVLEIPPEIGVMKFTSSFSASRQANNEFDIYLKYRTYKNAKDFCQLIYREFVIQAVLTGQLQLPGFIFALIDPKAWRKKDAWLNCAWSGISRPSVNMLQDVKAAKEAIDLGISTWDIQARKISGMSFLAVMQRQKRERDVMEQMGFVPSVFETTSGEPAYTDDQEPDVEE